MPYKDPAKKREANKLNARKLRAKDPAKYQQVSRDSYRKHIEKRRQYERERGCRKYGINIEEFETILKAQDGKCSICSVQFVELDGDQNFRPRIDHCHESGIVRGLLCNRCNRALGLFGDDPLILQRAAEYLLEKTK